MASIWEAPVSTSGAWGDAQSKSIGKGNDLRRKSYMEYADAVPSPLRRGNCDSWSELSHGQPVMPVMYSAAAALGEDARKKLSSRRARDKKVSNGNSPGNRLPRNP